MTASIRLITLCAGVLGFLGVALGAFGAHGLKAALEANGSSETWKTAVLYHLIHSVALLALAGCRDVQVGPSAKVAALWVIGVVLFSGSLYWLALGGPRILGPITPLGGAAFFAGWALLGWSAWKRPTT